MPSRPRSDALLTARSIRVSWTCAVDDVLHLTGVLFQHQELVAADDGHAGGRGQSTDDRGGRPAPASSMTGAGTWRSSSESRRKADFGRRRRRVFMKLPPGVESFRRGRRPAARRGWFSGPHFSRGRATSEELSQGHALAPQIRRSSSNPLQTFGGSAFGPVWGRPLRRPPPAVGLGLVPGPPGAGPADRCGIACRAWTKSSGAVGRGFVGPPTGPCRNGRERFAQPTPCRRSWA